MSEQPRDALRLGLLDRRHNRASFTCGVDSLDRYFRQFARQDVRRDVASVYVMNDDDSNRVAGYFTLCSSVMRPHDLPEAQIDRFPKYRELPAILLGRLAVDREYQGRQIGRHMLGSALEVSYRASRNIAAMAVVVDALDADAASFYSRIGFRSYASRPLSMYLLMSSVADFID